MAVAAAVAAAARAGAAVGHAAEQRLRRLAQAQVFAYLSMENEMISNGQAPTHEMTVKWLEACADMWQDDPRKFAESRGFSVLDKQSLANQPQLENK